MAGRNKLRGVAHAVLGSFISRNNDIDGYWGLGLLRSFADTAGVAELRFDLIAGTAEPNGALPLEVSRTFQQTLSEQLHRRRVAAGRVAQAEIRLLFNAPETGVVRFVSYGDPFKCVVSLVDANGQTHESSIVARCGPHDPGEERRSDRVTWVDGRPTNR
jgi:hypothetical protein